MKPAPKPSPLTPSANSKILVTGGGGFLGRNLVNILKSKFSVVSFDVQPSNTHSDCIMGSVTDPNAISDAMKGIDGLVIAHMAPRALGVYDSPEIPFDINVKGTALLLESAAKEGIRRVVLISSVGVVENARLSKTFLERDLSPSPNTLYGLTKLLQEDIARYYHQNHGIEMAILRPAYISDGETLEDKYGVRRPSVNWMFIDPRDIANAVLAGLTIPDLACETFYLMAGPEAEEKADIRHTMDRLGWQPIYRFTEFPRD